MLEDVTNVVPGSRLALHCHDTYGQALSNILTGLKASYTHLGFFIEGARENLGGEQSLLIYHWFVFCMWVESIL